MSEKWVAVNTGAPMFTAKELAAAEERGRRRGVEERDELRALLREVETTLAGQREIEGASPATVSAIVAKLAAYAVHHSALAPRDSAPDPDPTCHEDFEPPWPRDSGKDLNAKVGRSEDGLPVVNFDRDVLHGMDRK